MLRALVVACAVLVSVPALADDCTTRVVTDKVYDATGAVIVSEESRTSCGNGGSNLLALVGIDSRCYYYNVRGNRQLACQYPNGNWISFGDQPADVIDVFAGDTEPQSGKYSTYTGYQQNRGSGLTIFLNWAGWFRGSLDDESQRLHEQAMFLALENAKNGELVSWQNRKGTESGRIKVVATNAVQGGVCRRVLVELSVGRNVRNLNETACINFSTNNWHFIQ